MIYFENLLTFYESRWYKPTIKKHMSDMGDQGRNSKALKALKQNLYQWLKAHPDEKSLQDQDHQKDLKKSIVSFLDTTLGIDPWVCNLLDQEDYHATTQDFITRARNEFPDMAFIHIIQALRNVWVLISLHIYMDCQLVLSDATYAYSMLYPLTDNYLDDATISSEDKRSFNQRFFTKISTGLSKAYNNHEANIFRMIDLIYTTYPITTYPDVQKALIAIWDGQNKSLDQQDMTTIYSMDLLGQTFYKGGCSVLADAYLVKGTLNSNEAQFAYGYGILLQIADDLQDLETDLLDHQSTMINAQALHSYLDGLTNQYMLFIDDFFESIYQTNNQKQEALKQLLLSSVELLLFSAITEHPKHYTKKFMTQYKKKSRFSKKSFHFLNNRLRRLIEKVYKPL